MAVQVLLTRVAGRPASGEGGELVGQAGMFLSRRGGHVGSGARRIWQPRVVEPPGDIRSAILVIAHRGVELVLSRGACIRSIALLGKRA